MSKIINFVMLIIFEKSKGLRRHAFRIKWLSFEDNWINVKIKAELKQVT